MKCPKCQFENPEGAKFCNECGSRLEVACPECGKMNPPGSKVCGECGHNLVKSRETPPIDFNQPQSYTPKFLADKILTTRSSVEGERKLVTVLFADVVNYTAIVEKLDPEEVHQIMDGCFKILMDEIHKYQGTINQFTGDGVMALFGAPLAHEDHAQSACYAALSIQKALERYSEKLEVDYGLEFKMRMGLNSGHVVVGSIGDDLRMDYTAIGDTTNLAFRAQSMAGPGSILVCKNTYKKVSQYFEFEPLGAIDVKGKKEPLKVYELKDRIYRPHLSVARRIYSELVGREKELNKLELHVLKVINGEGSIVNIIGEPGIGKSRLIAELKKKDGIKKVTLLEGRALSIGKNLSFHPIIDILKSWAGIGEDDMEAESIEKLEKAIRTACPQQAGEVFPFIATLMGMRLTGKHAQRVKGIEGEALEKLILKNIRELMIKVAEIRPIVFILEDLHWSDLTTIEFLESLFRLAADHMILFGNVFRPNYQETSDRLLERIREKYGGYNTEIYLEPLPEHYCEVLMNNLTKMRALPPAIGRNTIMRAEGNPFFIEEVVRSFIDEGVVELVHGAFRVNDNIDSVVIPETIQDVLMARIDRLDEETKDLLKVASIIGRKFFYKILAEVTKPIEDIDRRLEYLKEAQLIRERKRMGEIEYIFNHGLTQEATYESILLKKRKELHLKVAAAIESVFQNKLPNFYGILAYHYSNGENLEKAEEYLIKAGTEALKSSASSEALNYYQEALKLYLNLAKYRDAADPDRLAMLEKNIALAFFNKGQYADALEYLDSVLEHWGVKSSRNKINIAFTLISDLLSLILNLYLPTKKAKMIPGKMDHEIFNLMEKRLISLAFIEPKRYFIEFLGALRWANRLDITKIQNGVSRYSGASTLFSWTGISFKLSKKILERVKGLINEKDIKEFFDYNLYELYYDYFKGNWLKYKEYDETLIHFNLKIGQIWQVSTYIFFRCSIKIDQGAFREAEILIGKLSEIWESYENENTREYLHSLKIKLLLKSRELYASQTEADEGISFAGQTGRELAVLYYYGLKATIQILLKDINGAKESLSHAKELLLKEGHIIPHFISSYLMSQFSFDLYLLEEAILLNDTSHITEYRKKACQSGKNALKNSGKYACDRIGIFKLMGIYYWLIGRQNKAVKWWSNSIKEGERLESRVELARSYMETGKRLLERKSKFHALNDITSEEYLEKARRLFEELDLQWDLEELDNIIAYRQPSS